MKYYLLGIEQWFSEDDEEEKKKKKTDMNLREHVKKTRKSGKRYICMI